MKKGLFAGSFDPPTLGHLDIIKRASKLCDVLYVGVAKNSQKLSSGLFTPNEKIKLLEASAKSLKNVQVKAFSSLVTDFAKKEKITFLIRGIRAFADFDYEYRMAVANKRLSGIETFFLMADIRHTHINSTLIKEIALFGGNLKDFVPKQIETTIKARIKKKR